MTRARTLALLALLAAGCRNYDRPRDARLKPRPDLPDADGRRLPIPEQEKRGRDRYAIPEDDLRSGPKAFVDRPSPTGR